MDKGCQGLEVKQLPYLTLRRQTGSRASLSLRGVYPRGPWERRQSDDYPLLDGDDADLGHRVPQGDVRVLILLFSNSQIHSRWRQLGGSTFKLETRGSMMDLSQNNCSRGGLI